MIKKGVVRKKENAGLLLKTTLSAVIVTLLLLSFLLSIFYSFLYLTASIASWFLLCDVSFLPSVDLSVFSPLLTPDYLFVFHIQPLQRA